MRRYRFKWFSAAVAAGFLLGVALLVESIFTYRYVTRHLVREHLSCRQASTCRSSKTGRAG